MHVVTRITLIALAAFSSLAGAQTCVTASFPTSNADPSASTDFVNLSTMNGGVFSDFSSITCTTPASADAFGFVKANTNHETTTAKVANVCYLQTLSQGSGYASRGSFMVDGDGNFVNAAGSAVASGDFETTADTGASSDYYYFNAVSIWVYIKDKSSAPEATLARLAFGFAYCFEAASSTACTIGSDTSGALTADTSASEIIFASTPSAAGKAACLFTVTPSASSTVTITTSGTAPTMVCAHQTAASTYSASKISTNTATEFAAALSVACANVALSTSTNTGSMVEIAIVAATTTTTTTTTTTSTSTPSTNSATRLSNVAALALTGSLLMTYLF